MELTPNEINWKIAGWNDRRQQTKQDIADLAALIGVAVNNGKKFGSISRSYLKRIVPVGGPEDSKDAEEKEMKRQCRMIGLRLPRS